MGFKSKKYRFIPLLLLAVLILGTVSCGKSGKNDPTPSPVPEIAVEAKKTAEKLWGTSCLNLTTVRQDAFAAIQEYADDCSATFFKNYLASLEQAREGMEKYSPILAYYRISFDKVLEEVKTTELENGSTIIWMLYNMGYIIKTPAGSFGIDISHSYAVKFAPYLDFLCITHNHSDHYDTELVRAMLDAGKPVISNYVNKGSNYPYTSTVPASYNIGSFRITTNINDHNSTLTNFVTTFQINCGTEGGDLVLMHVGDSNYKATQYSITESVDVLIPRYAPNALTENNVIGKVITPKYVLLSHILELAHAGVEESRWSLELGLERAEKLDCPAAYLPFWGEKMIWKNNKLN